MGNCKSTQAHNDRTNFNFENKIGKVPLSFKIKTWANHLSLDLNQTQHCFEKQIDAYIYQGEKIQINLKSQYERNQKNIEAKNTILFDLHCQIYKKNKCYTITFPMEEQMKYLWRFIDRQTQINEGDIVRIGTTKYKLIKFIKNKQQHINSSRKECHQDLSALGQKKCRKCLQDTQSEQNPLVSPCQCLQGQKYIHLRCLSKLLFQIDIEQNEILRIEVNKSICQLCKMDLVGKWSQQQMVQLLLECTNGMPMPFCIFQIYTQLQNEQKYFIIINFNKKDSFTLGRSHKADIIDKSDKCISKLNSKISYIDEKLTLIDMKSTHGTFIKIQSSINLDCYNTNEDIIYRNMLIKAQYFPIFDQ